MIKKFIFAVILLYLMLLASLVLFQEKLIFLPSSLPVDYAYSFNQPFEEINITAHDGAVLNAIHFKKESPDGVLLYYHGNAGDLSRWGELTSYFTQYNYDVLVMDYRTYGKSTGKISEEALYRDANLFYDYLKEGYNEKDIVVYGRSLGCAFATAVAAQNNPRALILESPFYNLTSVAKKMYPIFPVNLLLKYSFPNDEYIKEFTGDLLIIHGKNDRVIPFASGKKLFEVAPGSNKQFLAVDEATHNDVAQFDVYHQAIREMLQQNRN